MLPLCICSCSGFPLFKSLLHNTWIARANPLPTRNLQMCTNEGPCSAHSLRTVVPVSWELLLSFAQVSVSRIIKSSPEVCMTGSPFSSQSQLYTAPREDLHARVWAPRTKLHIYAPVYSFRWPPLRLAHINSVVQVGRGMQKKTLAQPREEAPLWGM